MSKAIVEGVINAISGYIAGFKIEDGKIGYGTTSEMDNTNGVAILKNYIRFYNGIQRTLFGCCDSIGYPYNGYLELINSMGTTLEIHHKYKNVSDEINEPIYRPKAIGIYGNQFNIGKIALFERGYIGLAYTDTIELWIGVTHKFLCKGTNTSSIGVDLPSKNTIDNITNNQSVQFNLEIVCDRTMQNTIYIKSTSIAQIYDNNGNVREDVKMVKGDVLCLRYYNGGWNQLYHNY